jgi:hypothetical protein
MSKSEGKNYYASSEKYREEHNNYMKEKVNCKYCDIYTARGNLSLHKKTSKHIKNYDKFEKKHCIEIKIMKALIIQIKTLLGKKQRQSLIDKINAI